MKFKNWSSAAVTLLFVCLQAEPSMAIVSAYIVPHPPLIVPKVGQGEEKRIQASIDAYNKVAEEIRDLNPDTIVLVSPHAQYHPKAFGISSGSMGMGTFARFGVPDVAVSVNYDEEFAKELVHLGEEEGVPVVFNTGKSDPLDHATMVPLYFIQNAFPQAKIVRSGFSSLDQTMHYRYGQAIAKAAERLNRRAVFVASGDLSHRLLESGPNGFAPEGPIFDAQLVEGMKSGDLGAFFGLDSDFWEAAGDCGLRSFQIMAGALDGKDIKASLLSYEGPFGVGYAVATFHITGDDAGRCYIKNVTPEKPYVFEAKPGEDAYVSLARGTLETFIRDQRLHEIPKDSPKDLLESRAGVFVTLMIKDELRGCVGTLGPTRRNIAEEIRYNTLSAAFEDSRFDPVRAKELPNISYEVSVLKTPQPIESLTGHDVRRHGIIVSTSTKSGVLLPDLPGIQTATEQRDFALMKGGIRPNEKYRMEQFEVIKHKAQTSKE